MFHSARHGTNPPARHPDTFAWNAGPSSVLSGSKSRESAKPVVSQKTPTLPPPPPDHHTTTYPHPPKTTYGRIRRSSARLLRHVSGEAHAVPAPPEGVGIRSDSSMNPLRHGGRVSRADTTFRSLLEGEHTSSTHRPSARAREDAPTFFASEHLSEGCWHGMRPLRSAAAPTTRRGRFCRVRSLSIAPLTQIQM